MTSYNPNVIPARRRGTVLIIVVGLTALLLTTFLLITRQLQADVDDGVLLMRDSQARIMLPAALAFILEAGRLGQHVDGETFGWTDIRDGKAGPRTARTRGSGSLPALRSAPKDEHSVDGWPVPGSHYRSDMRLWNRPPMAIRMTRAHNPVVFDPAWVEAYETAEDRTKTLMWKMLRPQPGNSPELGFVSINKGKADSFTWTFGGNGSATLTDRGLYEHWGKVWDMIFKPVVDGAPGFHGALTPQPVANTFDEFARGDPTPRPHGSDLGWFRIYREKEEDHNGDGSPWFDLMELSGHATFIITCGGGQTRGYRDWQEVQAFGATAVFDEDPYLFEQLRAQERIHWYRVQWTPYVGGTISTYEQLGLKSYPKIKKYDRAGTYWDDNMTSLLTGMRYKGVNNPDPRNNAAIPHWDICGSFTWIDKLEREPSAGGRPIW